MKYTKKQIEKLISLILQKYQDNSDVLNIDTNISTDIFECTIQYWEYGEPGTNVLFRKMNFNENIYVSEFYLHIPNEYNWSKLKDKNYCKQYAPESFTRSQNTLIDWYDAEIVEDDHGIGKYIQSLESSKVVEDFIYKVDDSKKLKVYSDYSIEEFFTSNYDDSIEIIAIDTNETLITIEKNGGSYSFIVDLTTEDGDNFSISTTIKSPGHLNKLIKSTVDSLRLYDEFEQYADDLEEIIS